MVTGSAKVNLNKTCFDAVPPLQGFYYPSPSKCLHKSQKKIAIRSEDQDHNVLHTDSGGSDNTESNNAKPFPFNESWPGIEHDDKYCEPLKRERAHKKICDREFWLHSLEKKESLQYQDILSGSEDEDSAWNSISLDQNQKQVFDFQRSTHREALQVQKRASKVLKSAKTLLCSGNATKDSCPTKKGSFDEDGLKQNSSLDNNCLLTSDDGLSHWSQGHLLNEKNPSVMISEDQVERNVDDTSVDSSDFLVSTEGLGRWSGTNTNSEEIVQPSFVYFEGTNENKHLNHYTSDLPFSQYWKANLNKDILYQWRIKRRIQLAREQAKSEKQDFVPTRIFTSNQVTSEVRNSPKITPTESENQLPQDVKLHVPWYSQANTSNKTAIVPNIQTSQETKSGISFQPQIFPHCQQAAAAASLKLRAIPDCQFFLLGHSAANILYPSNNDYQEPSSLLPNNTVERGLDQSDKLRTIETIRRSQSKQIFSLQKDQLSGESSETSNGFDPPLFSDYQSSDEEFSSDLMLQHLRKQRSKFKEQLRFIDEKLKTLFISEKD